MKKQSLKSLKLNKKTVSNLKTEEVKGGTITQPIITFSIVLDCFNSFVGNCKGSQILCA